MKVLISTAQSKALSNFSFLIDSKIPKTESYVDLKGNVIPARDYSKKADYDALINELYESQPQLYSMFGWNGASNVDQGALTKMWEDAKIDWKAAATALAKSKKA